jgi:hypothetical protein
MAEHADQCLNDMERPWSMVLGDVLSMFQYGYSILEKVYKIRRGDSELAEMRSDYDDGLIGWRDFSPVGQDTVTQWIYDENGKIVRVEQQTNAHGTKVVDYDRLVHFRPSAHKNNPEGRALLRPCYRPWFFKTKIEEIEGIGVERDLAGLPVATVPVDFMQPGAETWKQTIVTNYRDMVRKVRRDRYEGLVLPSTTKPDGLPSGFTFGLLTSGGRRPVDVNEIAKRYDTRIAMALMIEYTLLGSGPNGSRSLHSDKTETLALATGAWMQGVAESFKPATAELMRYNGWPVALTPDMAYTDIEKADVSTIIAPFLSAVQAGLVTPTSKDEQWVRDFIGAPKADEGEPLREPLADEDPFAGLLP